jgi:hypothetical protein
MNVTFQLLLVINALHLCLLQGCNIKTPTSPPAASTSSVVRNDDNYVLALSAANEFLSAWRDRHQDKGIAMLTPSLLKAKGEQWWRDEISGISNPHHEAYEITNGRPLADGRYVFDVWLYEYYTGNVGRRRAKGQKVHSWVRPEADRIVVIEVGPDDWRVDEAPDI